jgi:hypothetical protein
MWPNGDQGTRLHPEVLPPQRTAKLLVGLGRPRFVCHTAVQLRVRGSAGRICLAAAPD